MLNLYPCWTTHWVCPQLTAQAPTSPGLQGPLLMGWVLGQRVQDRLGVCPVKCPT